MSIYDYILEAEKQYENNIVHRSSVDVSHLLSKVSSNSNRTQLSQPQRVGNGYYAVVTAFTPNADQEEDKWIGGVVLKKIKINKRKDFKSAYLAEAVLTKYFGDIGVGPPCDASPTFDSNSKDSMNLFVASDSMKDYMYVVMNKMDFNLTSFFISFQKANKSDADLLEMIAKVEAQLKVRIQKMLQVGFLCVDVKAANVLVDATPGKEQFYLSDFDPQFCCSFDNEILKTGVIRAVGTRNQPCEARDKESYKAIIEGLIAISLTSVLDHIVFKLSFDRLLDTQLFEFLKGKLGQVEAYENEGGQASDLILNSAKETIVGHLETLEKDGFQPLFPISYDIDGGAVTGGPFSFLYNRYVTHYGDEAFGKYDGDDLRRRRMGGLVNEFSSIASRTRFDSTDSFWLGRESAKEMIHSSKRPKW